MPSEKMCPFFSTPITMYSHDNGNTCPTSLLALFFICHVLVGFGFPLSHPATNTSAGQEWLWSGVSPSQSWLVNGHDNKLLQKHPSAGFGKSLHLCLTYRWPRGSRATSGQSEQREPPDVSIPSHHLIATWNSLGSRCRPKLTERYPFYILALQKLG